jgi:hypothetical protein
MIEYSKGQSWGALKKAWIGFRIAKRQNDLIQMKEYAQRIRGLQQQLGLSVMAFPELGIE